MLKKLLGYISVVLLLTACPDDPNSPPSASFYSYDYLVSNAGTSGVNGEYELSGTYNSAPTYSKSDDSYYIFMFSSSGFKWGIDTVINDTLTSKFYYTDGGYPILVPPETDSGDPGSYWTIETGAALAPEITAVSPVSGYKGDEGSILRGNYIFSDPDGDSESGSSYKWYRCTDSGDTGVEISDATEQTYTLVSDDSGEWLRFEVTPVDDSGSSGTAVLSEAVQIGSF